MLILIHHQQRHLLTEDGRKETIFQSIDQDVRNMMLQQEPTFYHRNIKFSQIVTFKQF